MRDLIRSNGIGMRMCATKGEDMRREATLLLIWLGVFGFACRPSTTLPPAVPRDVDQALEAGVRNHDALRLADLLRVKMPRDPEKLAFLAVESGDLSLLKLLQRTAFDPNAGSGSGGESLLGAAARIGNHRAVSFLLGLGADPNARFGPNAAYLPLYAAIMNDNLGAAAALLEGTADPNARVTVDLDGRRVSTSLRHLALEFTDVSPLSGRPPDAAC